MENDKKPVEQLKEREITASIWRNVSKYGTKYAVTFFRSYRSGEEWKRSSAFGRGELVSLATLAAHAYERVSQLENNDRTRETRHADL